MLCFGVASNRYQRETILVGWQSVAVTMSLCLLQREYDENEIDPHYGDNKKEEEPEAMDLPDDLNLDGNDEDEGSEEKQGQHNTLILFIH